MGKLLSLLLVGSLILSFAGCSQPDGSQETPPAAPAPVVSDPAPAPAAPTPAAPAPARPTPLPAPAVKPDTRTLYPAYTIIGTTRKWGYIDEAGQFVIQPAFDQAWDFEADGLAIVRLDGKSGLINKDGEQVVAPIWDRIAPANDALVRVLFLGPAGQVVDGEGKLLFSEPLVTGNFRNGLAPYRTVDNLYGYVNRAGEVVIPAQYRAANLFQDGTAIVQVTKATYAVIDTAGKQLCEFDASSAVSLSENLVAFREILSSRWGYASVTNQVALPARYGSAGPFREGLAVVSAGAPYERGSMGLINTRGEFVIPAEYEYLEPLGAGLYAAAEPAEFPKPPEGFAAMALLTREGRRLTDFRYYNVQPVRQGLISVSDGKETYFLDTQGKRAPGLPAVTGFGRLQLEGSLIKVDVDGRVTYLNREGQVVWQSDNTMTLANGLRVAERTHRPNRATLVFYPEFLGLADPKAQEALNRSLRAAFLGGELGPPREGEAEPTATTDFGFTVRQTKGLVTIYETGFWYGWGAAHGMSLRLYYHVDAKSGALYTLADLFKQDSNFTGRLREIIRSQIITSQDKSVDQDPEVRPAHAFYISEDALIIYYRPYEISSYARGFVEYAIPWSEISDLIDTDGPFWKAFH